MKFKYKKKQLTIHLALGLMWTIQGVLTCFIFEGNPDWFDYVWFVFGGVYLTIYYHQKTQHYLSLENGILKENWPFGKKIKINDIISIKENFNDYQITTQEKVLKVNNQLIDKDSYILLKEKLRSIEK